MTDQLPDLSGQKIFTLLYDLYKYKISCCVYSLESVSGLVSTNDIIPITSAPKHMQYMIHEMKAVQVSDGVSQLF